MLRRYRIRDYKFNIIISVVALTLIGIVLIGSAKQSVQNKQILGLCIGIAVMVTVSLIDYSFILRFSWVMYVLNIVLLLFVKFKGKHVNGATRWIEIAGIQFQPSELAKIIMILFFAQYIYKHKEDLNRPFTLLKIIVLFLIPTILVYKQPALSTTITIFVVFCAILFIGGLSYKIIFGTLAVAVAVVSVFMGLILQPDQKILHEYQYKRIMAWIQPDKYENTEAYQTTNSIIAIGSGKLNGKGLNNNVVGSVKNGNFISEPQTDFIFAIAGEELGFIGCCIIIGLLGIIIIQCLWVAKSAKDTAGLLIASGMAALIGFQSFFNIGVTTGILPNTGLPLPFVSYGLTSLVSLYIGMGFVLNVGLQRIKYYNKGEEL